MDETVVSWLRRRASEYFQLAEPSRRDDIDDGSYDALMNKGYALLEAAGAIERGEHCVRDAMAREA